MLIRPGFVRAASRPPWHRPGQAAALSFNYLLRQVEGGGLSSPHETAAPHGALTQLVTRVFSRMAGPDRGRRDPCLQIGLSTCGQGVDLLRVSSVSDRGVPLVTVVNGTAILAP